MPDIKKPSWHVNGYQSLVPTPTTMHWFWQGSSPTWTTPRFICYYAFFGAYAQVHFYIFTPIAFLNIYIESCNLGERFYRLLVVMWKHTEDTRYYNSTGDHGQHLGLHKPPGTTNFWTYC